uniref:B box-type domain-containing protein n=1 Tax=Neolamprologus brichardi TaxID=32507 RepID=A0A3Q4MNN0_NEOBR
MNHEKLCCSVCLDLVKDPVTISCGHNYCMSCIKCRKIFILRPELVKNTMLAELVEDSKIPGIQPAPADLCYAGPEDVSCDACTGKKLKALKSCLVCLVSYCKQHLQPHYDSSAFDKHKLIKPSNRLKGNICSTHNEMMKMFCRTDQKCICYLCCVNEHKRHNTIEMQKEFEVILQNVHRRIQTKEGEVNVLRKEIEEILQSSDSAEKDIETIINELVSFIKEKGSNLKQQINFQQKTEERRVNKLQNKLKQEITELKRQEEELKPLSYTVDHTEFLCSYSQIPKLTDSIDSPSFRICPVKYLDNLERAVSEARDKLKMFLSEEWNEQNQLLGRISHHFFTMPPCSFILYTAPFSLSHAYNITQIGVGQAV